MTTTAREGHAVNTNLVCIAEEFGVCGGPVEYRPALSGTGVSYARCDRHWEQRLDLEEQVRAWYPVRAPGD